MQTSFLPKGNDLLRTEKKYCRLSQFKEGENKLRVVKRPIAGWIDWHENKPKRYRPEAKPKSPYDPEKPIKPFWDMYIWDYEKKDLFVLEVTQSSVIKSLTNIASDEDWGDMTQFDIKVKKEGTGKETRYSIQPVPHKPLSDDVKKALEASPVNLEALYDGGDPWTDLDDLEAIEAIDTSSVQFLAKVLTDSIVFPEKELVAHYLEFARPKLSKPLEEAIDIWLDRPDDLLKAYGKWLLSDNARQIRDSLQG